MGNCFVKPKALVNNSPVIFPDAQGLYPSSEGSSSTSSEPLQTYVSASLDFNVGTCSSNKDLPAPYPCSVNYAQIDHDSVVMKTVIPEQVSLGGSENQRSCKLANLLEKSFVDNDHPPMELVATRLSPILLSPLRKSSGKSSRMGVVHECKEDPVHSKTESPRTKFVGLIVNQLVKSLSSVRSNSVRSSSSKVDSFSSAMIFGTKAKDEISGTRTPRESPSLSSILSQINIEKNCQSRSSGLCRSYSLAVEGERAFGSPLSVESNTLWEKTRECSAFDEFSDSSSDLFDIDFLKPERVAGVTFSVH